MPKSEAFIAIKAQVPIIVNSIPSQGVTGVYKACGVADNSVL